MINLMANKLYSLLSSALDHIVRHSNLRGRTLITVVLFGVTVPKHYDDDDDDDDGDDDDDDDIERESAGGAQPPPPPPPPPPSPLPI